MTLEQEKQKNYLIPIIMMIALFAMISFVTNLAAPMGLVLKNQFPISNAEATLGIMANFIAYAFMGVPSGILLEKIGYKKTALLAIAVGFVGVGIQVLSGVGESFGIYLLGAFVGGFSMCMLNTVVNPMLNTLGGGGKKGNQLIQIGGTFNSLAGTLVPILVGFLVGNIMKAQISDIYPLMYIAMGIFLVVFIVLALMSLPEPHRDNAVTAEVKTAVSPFSFSHFNFGLIAIFIYVGIEVSVPATLNYYLAYTPEEGGLGIDTSVAGSVVGTYWFLMMIGRFIGASIGGKVSSKQMLTVASGLGALLVLAGMYFDGNPISMPVFISDGGSLSFGSAQVPINAAFFVLIGLCTSVMWGGIFNLAVEGLGSATAKASGFFMVMVCGGGIIPFIQNLAASSVGFLNSYWVMLVCLLYLLFYAVSGSKPKTVLYSDPV